MGLPYELRNIFAQHVKFSAALPVIEGYPITAYVNAPIYHPAVCPRTGYMHEKTMEDVIRHFLQPETALSNPMNIDAAIDYNKNRARYESINKRIWDQRGAFYDADGVLNWDIVFNLPPRMRIIRLVKTTYTMEVTETTVAVVHRELLECCICAIEENEPNEYGQTVPFATLLPCRHNVFCFQCAVDIQACSICRTPIESIE